MRGVPCQFKSKNSVPHGAFSATAILPGEDPAALKELHQKLIAELAPLGALEDDIGWTIARLVWRKETSCDASNCGARTRASVENPTGEIPPSVGRIARIARNEKSFRGTTRDSNGGCGRPGPERPRSQLRASRNRRNSHNGSFVAGLSGR